MPISAKHVIVYQEPGRFCGWPANNGAWQWGDEFLVGFQLDYFKENLSGHSSDRDRPSETVLARSRDGGETWSLEKPDCFKGNDFRTFTVGSFTQKEAGAVSEPINFAHPDFAMKVDSSRYYVSYDRGKQWQGPNFFSDFEDKRLTARTDYLVNGEQDCQVFISAFEPKVEAGIQDRAFCIRTRDGGQSFQFQGWITHEPLTVRSVMPSTVRLSETRLVSALRRRHDAKESNQVVVRCWVDIYESNDNGQTWAFLSKVADTHQPDDPRNGNPPSLLRLRDGRLCVAYGYRAPARGIRAKLSQDQGRTWDEEIILRDDGRTWDLGYPRLMQRSDGKIVVIYYFTTAGNPEQHIAATIWNPGH